MNLSVQLGRVQLRNPVMTAAGTLGYGLEFSHVLDFSRIGGFISTGISMLPSAGNPRRRVFEVPCGIINSVGCENMGVEAFLRDVHPKIPELGTKYFVNIFGAVPVDYIRLASILDSATNVHGLEVNLGRPDFPVTGHFTSDNGILTELLEAVRSAFSRCLLVKLSPETADLEGALEICREVGCDGVTVANSYRGVVIDHRNGKPILGTLVGGVSGPAIRPLSMYRVRRAVIGGDLPIVASGGISTTADALGYLCLGAMAVQVGSGTFRTPALAADLAREMEKFLIERRIDDINAYIGSVRSDDRAGCLMSRRSQRSDAE